MGDDDPAKDESLADAEIDSNSNNKSWDNDASTELTVDLTKTNDIEVKDNSLIVNSDETTQKSNSLNTEIIRNELPSSNRQHEDHQRNYDKHKENTTQEDRSEKRHSNYANNIKYLTSNGNLSLNENKGEKESTLLPDSNTVVRFSPLWRQTLTSSGSILLTFAAGLTSGFSAILLPQLKEPGSLIPGDATTTSWIASMAALPMGLGCIISGWMMEKLGRRTSHFVICAPFFVSWILIACAKNLTVMLIGRFLSGLCVGLLGPVGPVYIGETTAPKYRGFFLAGISLSLAIGILVAHLIGTFITWQWTAAICSVFPVLATVLLFIVPESPTWLISQKRLEDGVKSFGWLRGYSEEANSELKGLLNRQKQVESQPQLNWKEKLALLKSPEFWKPLFIMITFFLTCQFSGVNAVAFYSIDIVEKAVGSNFDHYVAMLSIDALRVVMSLVACIACRKYGRRPLCMISGVWTALSMIGLSMFLYFTGGKPVPGLSWLPLTCLLVYISAISIGFVPLPWMMCGEVFPTRVRGLGSGISSATTFTAFFIVVKTAPAMMNQLGEVFTFLIYGMVAFIGTIVLYFVLPETKDKSLQEIEEKFKSRPKC